MLIDRVRTRGGQACPDSLYAHQLVPPPRVPLDDDLQVDVAVVGAGFTGLSAALALAGTGIDCAVLEANAPGWGASGRNGGQINPGLKHAPTRVRADLGERAMRMSQNAADTVFELVEEHGISCDIRRGGTIRAAVDRGTLADLHALARDARAEGVDYRMLSREEAAAVTGSTRYTGGLRDPKGGQLNPLKYVLGIAAAAERAGARIYCDTPVHGIGESGGRWTLSTPQGTVVARAVMIATNGYSGPLVPRLARSLLPVYSAILASKPLPPALRACIAAGGESVFEAGAITTYYRVDSAGRLIFGGRGAMADRSGPGAFPSLAAQAERLWPGIGAVGWEYGWNGRLALTADHYPHVHRLGPAGFACLGYNGRGVAMATVMGQEVARMLASTLSGAAHVPAFPVSPIRPIALQPAWPMGVAPSLALAKARQWLRDRRV
ncbi:NAD(P)/FAD-dependent oxidoreductase [Aquibium microcysteis]|uniref:NAD(P)/FAD-dependent oxidoreductase n=1 Tax=Aquibium microcysteis TaxID=675281 RepID=UPI00165CF23F|nr:FAD-dependent oxidoreductase [Aquibium microcysteis]